LIVVTSIRDTEIAGIWEEDAFRTKIPTKGKWPILKDPARSRRPGGRSESSFIPLA
jgi:hypothetical protein